MDVIYWVIVNTLFMQYIVSYTIVSNWSSEFSMVANKDIIFIYWNFTIIL